MIALSNNIREASLVSALYKNVCEYPDNIAIADFSDSLSYKQLWKKIVSTSSSINNLGVDRSDRVIFVVPNSIDFVSLHFSILLNGSVSVPIDTGTSIENLKEIIDQVKPRQIIIDDNLVERFSSIQNEFTLLSTLKEKIVNRENKRKEKSIDNFKHISGLDLAVILYTSGSTGKPKGVMLTHMNTLLTIRNIIRFCEYSSKSFEVITLPLSHSFGLGHVYSNLFSGGGVYLEQGMLRFKRIINAIKEFKASGFPTTPAGIDLILSNYSELFKNHSGSLKQMVINSAPLMPNQTKSLAKLLPNIQIFVYYGLTEASRATFASLSFLGEQYFTTVGKPMEDISVSLSDDSEIIITGPTVSCGYWPDERFPISEDGYPILNTGDIGQFDNDQNLYIVGRIKDQINVGGYKVDPLEVENVIKSISEISNVGVFGSKQESSNEKIICYIQLKKGLSIDSNKVEEYCRGKIEHYKIPNEFLFIEILPLGLNGKLDRKKLKQIYKEDN